MPNNYFQFKQFIVQQEHCAMKVCTDACLFGALAASRIKEKGGDVKNILDIGTGTGLLSLMLAQQVDATIDAVELDESACKQAKENFEGSPWRKRLLAVHSDILQFPSDLEYDLIISNPPFFEDDLRSPIETRNKAMHDSTLTLQQLLIVIDKNLAGNGSFFLLLPYHRTTYFEELAVNNGFYLSEKIFVRQTPGHNYFRTILSFSRKNGLAATAGLTIKNANGKYTEEFTGLLKDYYLKL